jgi:spermidine synthase
MLAGDFELAPLVTELLLLYILLPALMVLPATFLMGFSFPVLQRVVHTDLARIGRRVGTLLLANVLGSMAGAMLTGLVLLDLMGTAGTFRLLTLMGGTFGVLAVLSSARSQQVRAGVRAHARSSVGMAGAGVAASLAALGLAVITPGQTTLWSAVHGAQTADVIIGEDGSGVSVLKTRQRGYEGQVVVFVNGLSQSSLPYGEYGGIHTALGALPAFIHPDPSDVAVIGLGSGDTAYAIGGRPEIDRIVCIEIIRPQLSTLEELDRRRPYAGLRALLADPRVEHVFGDGRAYLLRAGKLYDIIEADALRPKSAYAGNLYSEEYFTLLRDRLKPGGLAATWVPTPRVRTAFMNVFPHVLSLPDIFIGSNRPIVLDLKAVSARLSDPRVRRYYEVAGIDIASHLGSYLEAPIIYGPGEGRDAQAETNTDLFPRDEYDLSPIFDRLRRASPSAGPE